MTQPPVCESVLIADCGAVATKVALVDRVGRDYRVIGAARTLTTAEWPTSDVSIGVSQAIAQLESITGRLLLGENGDPITPERQEGSGVDSFVSVSSAALPLRVAVVGLGRDQSVAAALRALSSANATVVTTLAIDEPAGRFGTNAKDSKTGGPSSSVERLLAAEPEVIVMVGGVDGGAKAPLLELANIVACVGQALDSGKRPLVIYAGNRAVSAQVAERIGSIMEFRSVDNVLPRLKSENPRPLGDEIEGYFHENKTGAIPGIDKLSKWSGQRVTSSAAATEKVAEFLARRYELRVQALDLGGGSTSWVYADSKKTARAVSAEAGLAYGLDNLAEQGMEAITRWLPSAITAERAHAILLNQALRPSTTPVDEEERRVLNAAARVAAAQAMRHVPPEQREAADLVLLTGAPPVRGEKLNGLMLLALDALDARGVSSVAVDPAGIVPCLGGLAGVNPEAAAQVLERDTLMTLGTAVVANLPKGRVQGPALRVRVETPSGKLEVEVAPETIELVPLGLGEKARIEVTPAPGVTLGVPLTKGVFKREVQGGLVGLMIDARNRPLLAGDLEANRKQAEEWLRQAGA